MFVDASATLAILLAEPEKSLFARKLSVARRKIVSPISLFEVTANLMRIRKIPLHETNDLVRGFLQRTEVETVAIDAEIGRLALSAFDRYGRGRHKAKLNFGDCFAYACAKAHRVPLLFKGNDFVHTDIEQA